MADKEQPTSGPTSGASMAEPAAEPPGASPKQIGQYQLLRQIGEGGMGVVYEAEQARPHRRVALKLIRTGIGSARLLHRFEHEAEILGQLQHPGIAQIYEAGTFQSEFGAQPFFAMEYVEGQPLTDYVTRQGLNGRSCER
jgi:non-specific serine/threonine protein kinase/serine/threonine-protein kinase